MQVCVSDAQTQLTELVRRAESGEEVVLTRHGQAVVRLVPARQVRDRSTRRELLEAVRRSGARRATVGPDAPRSQDFLHTD